DPQALKSQRGSLFFSPSAPSPLPPNALCSFSPKKKKNAEIRRAFDEPLLGLIECRHQSNMEAQDQINTAPPLPSPQTAPITAGS
ncbi:hypothetical protein PanWU01x14_319000, partial [Parasponia andersonii]